MPDAFSTYSAGLDSPASFAAAVTPNDSTDLAHASRALWIGGAGNIQLTTVSGSTVTLTGIPAGSILPVRASRIWATSTTATAIVALW